MKLQYPGKVGGESQWWECHPWRPWDALGDRAGLGCFLALKPWTSPGLAEIQEQRHSPERAHGDGEEQGASGFRGNFFCVRLIMQHFFKSNTYLCWMTFVPFAQGLKPVQQLRTKTESSSEQSPVVPNSHTQTESRGCAFTHTGNWQPEHKRKTTAFSHKPELSEKRRSPFSRLTFGPSNYSQAVTFARDSVQDLGSELEPHWALGHVLTDGKSWVNLNTFFWVSLLPSSLTSYQLFLQHEESQLNSSVLPLCSLTQLLKYHTPQNGFLLKHCQALGSRKEQECWRCLTFLEIHCP